MYPLLRDLKSSVLSVSSNRNSEELKIDVTS